MPYKTVSSLPKLVQSLPLHAKEIFLKAFNNAWREYKDPSKRKTASTRDVTARRVTWSAVKKMYQKVDGKWIRQ